MRTTVTIDDDLYREARARAALSGQSVGSVIEDALRQLLVQKPLPQRRLPRLLVHSSGIQPGVDINDTSAVIDMLDEGVPLDEVR